MDEEGKHRHNLLFWELRDYVWYLQSSIQSI